MYKKQLIHFVGVGGIGMSGLARVLLSLGYKVSGSDLRENDVTCYLATHGGEIFKGHDASNVGQADVVVISSAVREDNPEVVEARRLGIPVIPRAEMLSELMRFKKFGIAVAGAHGKTSTTSMVASVLEKSGLDPTVIIGGKVSGTGSNAYWGRGDFLVAEADESDGSFLRLDPSIEIITNIDLEHLDHYRGMDEIRETFSAFMNKIPFYGMLIVCGDDEHLPELSETTGKNRLLYGVGENCSLRAVDIESIGGSMAYTAVKDGVELGRIRLNVPGLHHVRNSLAALATGLEIEIPFERIREGLEDYRGVDRRFQILGEHENIIVMDDYAHHPTEIEATLAAARVTWPERRLLVMFEPHRYTRTAMLIDDFPGAFRDADMLWVSDIYPASESPLPGVSGENLAKRIRKELGGEIHYGGACSALPEVVIDAAEPGDVIITMGAGSIGGLGHVILEALIRKDRGAVAL